MKFSDFRSKIIDEGYSLQTIQGHKYAEKAGRYYKIDPFQEINYEEFDFRFASEAKRKEELFVEPKLKDDSHIFMNEPKDVDLYPSMDLRDDRGGISGGMFVGHSHPIFKKKKERVRDRIRIHVPSMAKFDPIVPENGDVKSGKKYSGDPNPDHLKKFEDGSSDSDQNLFG